MNVRGAVSREINMSEKAHKCGVYSRDVDIGEG